MKEDGRTGVFTLAIANGQDVSRHNQRNILYPALVVSWLTQPLGAPPSRSSTFVSHSEMFFIITVKMNEIYYSI